jgi:hypothetical protein
MADEPRTMHEIMSEAYDRLNPEEAEDASPSMPSAPFPIKSARSDTDENETAKNLADLDPDERDKVERAKQHKIMETIWDRNHGPEAKAAEGPHYAPHEWSDDAKDKFEALAPHAQYLVLGQWKEMQSRAGDLPGAKKWEGYLAKQGRKAEHAFDQLMRADYVLRQGSHAQKRAMIAQLAAEYGVGDLDRDANDAARIAARSRGILAAFEGLVDAQGAKQFPHAAVLRKEILSAFSNGEASTLREAYGQAIADRPDLMSLSATPKTMRETMSEVYDRIQARERAAQARHARKAKRDRN